MGFSIFPMVFYDSLNKPCSQEAYYYNSLRFHVNVQVPCMSFIIDAPN